ADGDKVSVGPGAQLTLFFFGDNHREQIQGEASFTVTASGSQAPAGKKTVTQTPAALKVAGGTVQGLNSDQYGGSVKRGGDEQKLSTISERKSLSATPNFR